MLLALACAAPSGGGWEFFRGADDSELNWGVCPDLFPPGCQLAVLSGDLETGADLFLRIPAGYEIPQHAHSGSMRMLGVSGRWQLDSDAHRRIDLAPGAYAVEPALAAHRVRCVGDEPCVLFLAFGASFDAVKGSTVSP